MHNTTCCCQCSFVGNFGDYFNADRPRCPRCKAEECSRCPVIDTLSAKNRRSYNGLTGDNATQSQEADSTTIDRHKTSARTSVWDKLRTVAMPDSRFHHDYGSFIPDFQGSAVAVSHLRQLPQYQSAGTVFITPDNCLEGLRYAALRDGKRVLTTTYGIRRGFWLLDPGLIGENDFRCASMLDGMEKVGQQVSLRVIRDGIMTLDLLVTGTGAVDSRTGLRYGKGHGFFDLEWGMLYMMGVVGRGWIEEGYYKSVEKKRSEVIVLAHDFQVTDEVRVEGDDFDTVGDLIVTPTRIVEPTVSFRQPRCGILWDRLETGMVDDIPPLHELQELVGTEESD